MAIYNRFGAKVEFVACYKTKWHQRGFFFVKAKQVSAYPDGSGKESIGKIEFETNKTKGWQHIIEFTATNGFVEIDEKVNEILKLSEEKIDQKLEGYLLNLYWPHLFKKNGEPKKPNQYNLN